MKKLKIFPTGKKGFNDITILSIIIGVFLITSAILPSILNDLQGSSSSINNDALADDIAQVATDVDLSAANNDRLNFWRVLWRLALWDIDDQLELPFWLEWFYTLLTILLVVIIARNTWIGGGG